MSRIHEALKRAEQERAAGQQYGPVTIVREPAESSIAGPAIEASVAVQNDLPPTLAAQPKTEEVPGIARFEDLWASCTSSQWKPDSRTLVFADPNTVVPGTEQFRTLRSRLYRIRQSQPLQTLLISSAIPAEGKTVVAANLAYAIVRQQGSRVLLIDADLRAPRLHTLLGVRQSPGLADFLQGDASESEVIQRGQEEGMCFMAAGKHVTHPAELISSKRMKDFLERMKPLFDWIIIDSPPALAVSDASVLGGLCDGVLLVVRAGSTPAEASQKACQELRAAHIIGVVLNQVRETAEYGSYYGYGDYGLAPSLKAQKQ